MSRPLTLEDHRCPGCGRVARVVPSTDPTGGIAGPFIRVWDHGGWAMRCDCEADIWATSEGPALPTLRWWFGRVCPIGPGLGRLLVEVLERRSVVAGPSRDEIRATLRRLPADELLEWAVIGASPPVPNCGHRGPDGCCNYPGHVSAECHAGAPCPLVTIASGPRLTPLIPPDLRGLAMQPEEAAALARSLPESAHLNPGEADDRTGGKWATPVGPGLYRDAFGRLTQGVWVSADGTATDDELAYTSAPPSPSPDGVTWYGYRSPGHSSAWLAVKWDTLRIYTTNGRQSGRAFPGSSWGPDERRTLHPVSRPEWAEGEGS